MHNVSARVCYGNYVRRTPIWLSNETSLMHVSFNGCAETCTLIMRQPACQDIYSCTLAEKEQSMAFAYMRSTHSSVHLHQGLMNGQ